MPVIKGGGGHYTVNYTCFQSFMKRLSHSLAQNFNIFFNVSNSGVETFQQLILFTGGVFNFNTW